MEQAKPRRIVIRSHPDPERAKRGEKVKAQILDFKIIEEHWNIYELEDGTRVKLRVSPAQFHRPLDPQTGREMCRDDGMPIYGTEFGVEVVFEPSEKAIKP